MYSLYLYVIIESILTKEIDLVLYVITHSTNIYKKKLQFNVCMNYKMTIKILLIIIINMMNMLINNKKYKNATHVLIKRKKNKKKKLNDVV